MPLALSLRPARLTAQWDAEPYARADGQGRVLSIWRLMLLVVGPLTIIGAAAAAFYATSPATRIQTRIVADGSATLGRAVLAEAALRIGAAPGRTAALDEHGTTLILSIEDADAASALRSARSAAEMLMNLPIPAEPVPPTPPRADIVPDARPALWVERVRLSGLLQSSESRAATVSAALSTLMRDMATAARQPPPDRKASRETLDKGSAALASLQLRRIQLQSLYQDDFPAVSVVDSEIRALKGFLQTEARRIDAAPASLLPDPGDPILTSERDRLRAELNEVNDRSQSLATALAKNTQALADLPAQPAGSTCRTATARHAADRGCHDRFARTRYPQGERAGCSAFGLVADGLGLGLASPSWSSGQSGL